MSSPRAGIKCFTCDKTVYPLELVSVGSNNYHKLCFKCSTCSIALTLKNAQEKGGLVYCLQHIPKEVATSTADRHDLNTIKEKPKVENVNQQVRGELAGQKSLEGTDSVSIGTKMNAPKVGVVNEQVRGELAGQKSNLDMESGSLKNAMAAPKVGLVNEQIRSELAGQKPNVDLDSVHMKSAANVPKVGVVNEQIRGELAGQKPNVDIDSAHIKSALDAPKTDANLQIKKTNVELAKGDAYHV